MHVTVRIPEALRRLTRGEAELIAEGETVNEIFNELDARFPGVRQWAFNDEGAMRPYVNVFVNRRVVRSLDDESARVSPGDYVSVIPAIEGSAKSMRKVYLTFPKELIKEPLIFRLGHELDVVTNIRGASVSDEIGLVALEIEGEPSELDRAVEWLKSKGVKVEPLDEE
jgi:molybdopterin converting factor small subunit